MSHDLLAYCDTCKAPVADGDGALWADMADVDRTATNTQAWEMLETKQEAGALSFSAGSLMSYPEPARWQVHHSACNPSPDARAYAVEVHRCRSWADLVWWTAHLMGKTWLQHTDWEDLLQETAEAAGTRITPATPPESHR
ncbi:hypothetical protein [Streptomyces sp. NRRL F-5053]|uniref:hypothetical protein n=1 Tax=Streptomyces sp. NRRL F-5053 TaxID=1463854 RepID=UPI0004CAB712|nr:hypothetical protein [Streptomyces sp. NRRL F-5053]